MFRVRFSTGSSSRLGLRVAPWLALLLLLFAQITLATHDHDTHDSLGHDCTVCSQLHSVKHTACSGGQFFLPAAKPHTVDPTQPSVSVTWVRGRPVARAPPRFSH